MKNKKFSQTIVKKISELEADDDDSTDQNNLSSVKAGETELPIWQLVSKNPNQPSVIA